LEVCLYYFTKVGDLITDISRRLSIARPRIRQVINFYLPSDAETLITASGEEIIITKSQYMNIFNEMIREIWVENYNSDNELIEKIKTCQNAAGLNWYIKTWWLQN
jgi:hypothetical protein